MRRKMFTLVELMIVVIIVAILASAAVPIYQSVVSRGYGTEVTTALSTFRTAQRMYRAEYGSYPTDVSTLEEGDLIDTDDFVDMKYVDYTDLSIDGSGGQTWNGDIKGYKYNSVDMDASGNITRNE